MSRLPCATDGRCLTVARGLLCAGLLWSIAAEARANQIITTDCAGSVTPVTSYARTDTICVTGDVDGTCPRPPIMVPAADVYIVPTGADPFSATPVHFETLGGFGSFIDVVVRTPPLPCGTFDLLMDERCDGRRTAEDVFVPMAFTVSGAGCTPDAGPPDAGRPDAGALDAGVPDAGPDALDAGAQDAGASDAGADAGLPPTDAGAGEDAGPATVDEGGCGCAAASRGSVASGALAFSCLALVVVRRRRGTS